jgi:uncharacterized MAPEG superfamily protein
MTSVHWLVATVLWTAVLWLPYGLERMASGGVWSVLDNPKANPSKPKEWARRAAAAHRNAIENVPLVAGVVLSAAALGQADAPVIVLGAQVFFAARVLYTVVYIAGIPVVRTVAFTTGWVALVAMSVSLLA